MTRLVKNAALSLIILMLSGCATEAGYRNMMESYRGANEQRLLADWGIPTKIVEGPNGMKAYRYENYRDYTLIGNTSYTTVPVYHSGSYSNTSIASVPIKQPDTNVRTFCFNSFVLDKTNIVIDYHFNGPDCTAP